MTTHPAVLGRYFEDFVVGDVYQHPLGRTISEADNTWLTMLTMNTNQQHVNAHLAAQNPITGGRVIVNSGLRASTSRPYAGIVSMVTRGLTSEGEECISYHRSVMVATRASEIGKGHFPQAKNGPLEK